MSSLNSLGLRIAYGQCAGAVRLASVGRCWLYSIVLVCNIRLSSGGVSLRCGWL